MRLEGEAWGEAVPLRKASPNGSGMRIKASGDKPNLGLDTGAPSFRSARCTSFLKIEGYCSLRIGIGLALGSG